MSSISVTESTDTAAVTVPPPLTIQKGLAMTIIFTGCIYDSKKILKQYPDALLVCVMRRPFRYAPRDVLRIPDLGPPNWLLNYALEHENDVGQECIDLQAYYAAEYIKYLESGANSAIDRLMNEMNCYDKVVLLCRERIGEFCHRHLLRYYLIDDHDIMNGGEIRI